jgi:hypothetical protein
MVPAAYAQNIVNQYLTTTAPGSIQASLRGAKPFGCTGVTGGLNGGAK